MKRGPVNLEVRYPKEIDGIAADPQPDWSFDALLVELNSVEKKLKESSKFSYPLSKTHTRYGFTSSNTLLPSEPAKTCFLYTNMHEPYL